MRTVQPLLLVLASLLLASSAFAGGRTFTMKTAMRGLTLRPNETRVTVRLPPKTTVWRHGMFGIREARYPGVQAVKSIDGKVHRVPGWYDVNRASKKVGGIHVYTAGGSLAPGHK